MILISAKRLRSCLCIVLLMSAFVCHAERKETVAPGALPPLITDALKKHFPDAQVLEVEQEVEGEDPGQYDMVIRSGGKDFDVELSPAGELIEKKETMASKAKSASPASNQKPVAPAAPVTPPASVPPKTTPMTMWLVILGVAFAGGLFLSLRR
jgi:hypothetical protein